MFRSDRFLAALAGAWLCIPLSAAQAEVLITIDKTTQQMTVEVDGATRWVWPVSTGRRSYDTPAGDFHPFRMVADHYSKEWDDAPMPHSIFFTEQGHAIHGSFETSRLGSRASHGCVRLSTGNASRLYALVQRQGLSNTRVTVLPDREAPVVAKRKAPATIRQAHKPATETVPGATSRAATTAPMPGPAAFPYIPGARSYGYAPQPAWPQQQPAYALPARESQPFPYRLY